MLWELFSVVALFQWNKHRVLVMHSSISTTAFCLFIYIWICFWSGEHCHTFLVFAHFVVKTSLRIQSDVEQINSVHRCVSPIQWHILEFETQRELSLSLSRPFAFSISLFFSIFAFFCIQLLFISIYRSLYTGYDIAIEYSFIFLWKCPNIFVKL